MRTSRSTARSEEGAILILALLFIGIIGLLVLALVTTTTSVVAGSKVKRDYLSKTSAADAGLQYGIQQVRSRTELCPSAASNGLLNPPASFTNGVIDGASKDIQVRVSCQVVVDSLLGSGGYALVTRDTTKDNAITSGANGVHLPVSGPVYLGGNPQANPSTDQGDLSFAMSNGDVVMDPQSGICPPLPRHLTLAGAPYGYGCSSTPPLPPANIAPTVLPPVHANGLAPDFTPADNCAVFLPGTYDFHTAATPQKLALLDQNYFVSGVYYFNNVVLDLTNKNKLVGGRATDQELLEDNNPSPNGAAQPLIDACSSDANAKTATGYDSQGTTGVKIVLGPNAAILVDNPDGDMELFARNGGDAAAEGLQGVSVMTVQQDQNDFKKSNLGFDDNALRAGQPNGGGGSTLTFVIHGFVYTPNAKIQVRINRIPARFFSGIDTGRLDIGTSNNVSGFSISVTSKPVVRQYRLTAVACGNSTTDGCTAGYDGGQNIVGTAVISVNSKTQDASVASYHVGTG